MRRRRVVVAFTLLVAVALATVSFVAWRARRPAPKQTGPILRLLVSPDASHVLSVARDRDVLLARVDCLARQPFTAVASTTVNFDVTVAAVSSGASSVVLAGRPQLAIWTPETDRVVSAEHVVWPSALAVSPDGSRVALGDSRPQLVGLPCCVVVLDARTGRECARAPSDEQALGSTITALAFSPDGRQLLVSTEHTLALRDAVTLEVVRSYALGDRELLAFDASGGSFVWSKGNNAGACDTGSGATLWSRRESLIFVGQVRDGRLVRYREEAKRSAIDLLLNMNTGAALEAEAFHMKTGAVVNAARLPERAERTAVTAFERDGQLWFVEGTSGGALHLHGP